MPYSEAQGVLDAGAVAILPVGATEAHGPHLPLSTDVIIADACAERAARVLVDGGHGALVLPALPFGVTEFAAAFAGTISIASDTVTALVRDVIIGACRSGFLGVVVSNAHLEPAQIAAVRAGVEAANRGGGRAVFPDVTRRKIAARLGEEFQSGACHAGRYETSLVLGANASLVDTDRAAALPDNPLSLVAAIAAGKQDFIAAGGPLAYFGAPARGSASEGDQLLDEHARILVEAAQELIAG